MPSHDEKMNLLAILIRDILVPVVGDIVAAAMIEKQCKVIGISPKYVAKEHLDPLADKIEHVLVIFGHDEEGVGERIRALKSVS